MFKPMEIKQNDKIANSIQNNINVKFQHLPNLSKIEYENLFFFIKINYIKP